MHHSLIFPEWPGRLIPTNQEIVISYEDLESQVLVPRNNINISTPRTIYSYDSRDPTGYIAFLVKQPALEDIQLHPVPDSQHPLIVLLVENMLLGGKTTPTKLRRVGSPDYPDWIPFLRDLQMLNARAISDPSYPHIKTISFPASPHRNFVEPLKMALAGKLTDDITEPPRSGRSRWPKFPAIYNQEMYNKLKQKHPSHCFHCDSAGLELGCSMGEETFDSCEIHKTR